MTCFFFKNQTFAHAVYEWVGQDIVIIVATSSNFSEGCTALDD